MGLIRKYPAIQKVALEIAYDNGLINRFQTEDQWLDSLDPIIGADGVDTADLELLDGWCLTLLEEEIITVAAGDQDERAGIENRFPRPELFGLFNDIFEGRGYTVVDITPKEA